MPNRGNVEKSVEGITAGQGVFSTFSTFSTLSGARRVGRSVYTQRGVSINKTRVSYMYLYIGTPPRRYAPTARARPRPSQIVENVENVENRV